MKDSKTEVKKCRACHGTGWRDYPVCLSKCTTCRGSGYVRV